MATHAFTLAGHRLMLTDRHVRDAVRDLLRDGFGPSHQARRYAVPWPHVRPTTFLPPKEILRRAIVHAGGPLLPRNVFTGGKTGANALLGALGFTVVEHASSTSTPGPRLAPTKKNWRLKIGLYLPWRSRVHGPGGSWINALKPGSLGQSGLDLVLFPEAFDILGGWWTRARLKASWGEWARTQQVAVAVGIYVEDGGQELWLFSNTGKLLIEYRKHATTRASALDVLEYNASAALQVAPVGPDDVPVGLTLCHDHYLSPLQAELATQGALVVLNPSFSASDHQAKKWTVCQRARAVESRVWSFCTLNDSRLNSGGRGVWGIGKARLSGFSPEGDAVPFVPWAGGSEFRVVNRRDSNARAVADPLWVCEIGPGCRAEALPDADIWSDLSTMKIAAGVTCRATRTALEVDGQSVAWKPGEVSMTKNVQVVMLDVATLASPRAAWRCVANLLLSDPVDRRDRWMIWCQLTEAPPPHLRWIAASRNLEMCLPVVLTQRGRTDVSCYALVQHDHKIPARVEDVADVVIPLGTVTQGGGVVQALNILENSAPSREAAHRRRINFLRWL